MFRSVIAVLLMILAATVAQARDIKVLIMDDVFKKVPGPDERLTRMGKIRGDLLVKGNHYRGNIEVWKGNDGLFLVNELPLEDYVRYVVRAEVGMNWEMEALKAQAVIARTYALFRIKSRRSAFYDLTSSVLHQVYKGASMDSQFLSAVRQTAGEVLVYNGELIESLYHSTCGGKTEVPEEVFGRSFPYLKSVESSCEISPYWIWERTYPLEEISQALGVENIRNIAIASYTSTGRVKTVSVEHEEGTLSVKATDLRRLLGWKRLPSTKFTLFFNGGELILEGKGYGHGVGLCQWSALEMARKGMNYKEILAFYYPGTSIRLYEDF